MQSDTITLQLDVFEGPLDLLLYLIKKNDLEISRISVARITDQYLQYLDGMKELDIDGASEFLFMAAELAYIKSKTLLPKAENDTEDGEDGMGQDLVARLKEYERYKMAAQDLKKRHWLHRDIFVRGSFFEGSDEETEKKETETVGDDLYEVDTFELIKAFHEILNRLPKEEVNHKVLTERVSVTDRIYEILDFMKQSESLLFEDLFAGDQQRIDVVVSFLALLEMTKLKILRIYQTSSFAPIRLQRCIEVNDDILKNENVLETLEEYK